MLGQACRLYRDSAHAQQVETGASLIPWDGDPRVTIDRFDARTHLSYYAEPPAHPPKLTKEQAAEETRLTFERWSCARACLRHWLVCSGAAACGGAGGAPPGGGLRYARVATGTPTGGWAPRCVRHSRDGLRKLRRRCVRRAVACLPQTSGVCPALCRSHRVACAFGGAVQRVARSFSCGADAHSAMGG